ncbi:MAG: diguanylate cyclase [Epsilonproteobacteria bacterium]|nr:diguanylate cyclase [Campylobacterota bacterium]
MNKYSTSFAKDLGDASTPLEKFAKKVLDKLIEEGTPPIPYYYKIYFLNMLDEEPIDFRKQVYELISIEENSEDEKDLELEKKLKLSFKYSKEILQRTALLYKTSTSIRELIKKHLQEIVNGASPKTIEKILNHLEAKIETISVKMENELKAIKNLYSKNVEVIKEIESNSMFDQKYGVYNKNYFLKLVKKEIDLIDRFSHVSSIITIKIKDSVLANFSEKSKILANRSVAKIILKTSRRTDIVAHLGDGVFAMLLKHTDRIGASKTIERLADMISMSAVFLEGEEVELAIVGGVAEIKEKKDVNEYLNNVLKAMKEAEQENTLYKVYEG